MILLVELKFHYWYISLAEEEETIKIGAHWFAIFIFILIPMVEKWSRCLLRRKHSLQRQWVVNALQAESAFEQLQKKITQWDWKEEGLSRQGWRMIQDFHRHMYSHREGGTVLSSYRWHDTVVRSEACVEEVHILNFTIILW